MKRHIALLFLYGAVLCLLAMVLAGAGHGSYLMIAIGGAPFSGIGVAAALFACALQWGGVVLLLRQSRFKRAWMIAFLLFHYLSAAAVLLWPGSDFNDFDRLTNAPRSMTMLFVASIAWYLCGQILLWVIAFTQTSRSPEHTLRVTQH